MLFSNSRTVRNGIRFLTFLHPVPHLLFGSIITANMCQAQAKRAFNAEKPPEKAVFPRKMVRV